MSFEAGGYLSGLLVHGSEGWLKVPDANAFGGELMIRGRDGEWSPLAYTPRGDEDARGVGLHEMVTAVREGRPHRATGELGLHVLESALAVLASIEEGRAVPVTTTVAEPGIGMYGSAPSN